MSYLGNTPEVYQYDAATQKFSGTGSQTVFTLNRRILDVDDVIAVVENVIQEPTAAYTLSANTTSGTADITFTSAPPSGTNNIQVRYTAISYIAYNVVDGDNIFANTVPINRLQTSGTANSQTFLRGDGVFSLLNLNSITGDLTVTGNVIVNSSGYLSLPVGNTAQAPTSGISNGSLRFSSSNNTIEFWNGTEWSPISASNPTNIDLLVVAGGGGGGGGIGGGGGAGGIIYSTSQSVSRAFAYTVTVGSGGVGGLGTVPVYAPLGVAEGTPGSNSVFGTSVAIGGGRGGSYTSISPTPVTAAGAPGGSGGGGAGLTPVSPVSGGTGTPGQGNNGGVGLGGPGQHGGGGGGGAAATGGAGVLNPSPGLNDTAGDGGSGSPYSISGSSVTYGGGGGGGGHNSITAFGGLGGSGGGGEGGINAPSPTSTNNFPGDGGARLGFAGTANRGGGGGAGYYTTTPGPTQIHNGWAGGSGTVIISYDGTKANGVVSPGLTFTNVTSGDKKVYTFTAGTGTITWN
jgi:hypothetical protein